MSSLMETSAAAVTQKIENMMLEMKLVLGH